MKKKQEKWIECDPDPDSGSLIIKCFAYQWMLEMEKGLEQRLSLSQLLADKRISITVT